MGFSWTLICDSSLGIRYLERRMGLAGGRCASPRDGRSGRNARYAMRDISLAAFPLFPMRSPSLLSHRRLLSEGRGIPDARTLFGMGRIPCGNRIRRMLDGVPPEHFDGVFSVIVTGPGDPCAVEMRCPEGALDGSERSRRRLRPWVRPVRSRFVRSPTDRGTLRYRSNGPTGW